MKVLENIKRVLESIEEKKHLMSEEDKQFVELFEKYQDVPKDRLKEIIADVKTICMPSEDTDKLEIKDTKEITEDLNNVEVKDASEVEPEDIEHTDANKAESARISELDASEDCEEDDDLIISEEDEEDDDLIISEEDEEEDELIVSEENEEIVDDIMEDNDVLFDEYQDELDIAEADCSDEDYIEENADKIDMTIPGADDSVKSADKAANENAEKIDLAIPERDDSVKVADAATKETVKEDNSGAKAAIANRDNKGAFSSDIDALTDYLDEY